MLNQYLANIYIFRQNLYNLYINTNDNNIKNNLLVDIKNFNYIYLNISLLIKKIGGFPIINFNELQNISTIKLLSSKDYTLENANKILLTDFKIINNMNNKVGEYALKILDLKSINLVLEINKLLEERTHYLNFKT